MFPLVAQTATSSWCLEFREPSAREELMQLPPGRRGATRLLAELVRREDAARFGELTLCERDRLVARLYEHCFGPEIDARAVCRGCSETAHVRFELDAFVARVAAPRTAEELVLARQPDGTLKSSEKGWVRLPRVADEDSVAQLSVVEAEAHMRSLCLSPSEGVPVEELESWLDQLGPMIEAAIDVRCAHCGAGFEMAFDLCSFFVAALESEQPLVLREIHWLARAYGWSLAEIQTLPRSQRRQLVQLVLADADRRGAA